MLEERKVTCVVCPIGCEITVKVKGKEILELSGYQCKRGTDYARAEVIEPKRVLTTTVRLENGHFLPVKTAEPIPKERIFDAIRELKDVEVKLPVKMGQVVHKNIVGSNVDVVATRSWVH